MSQYKPRAVDFRRGMETTTNTRKTDPFNLVLAGNVRVDSGSARRRNGIYRLGIVTAASNLTAFDGTNDYATLGADTRVTTLGLRFTLETLFNTTTVAAAHAILGKSSATGVGIVITHTTSSTVTTLLTTSGGGTTTITNTGVAAGATHAYQLKRDGASVTVTIDGTAQTGTISATENMKASVYQLGADNGANFYLGRIDFLRILRVVKTSQMDGWCRLLRSRDTSVICDYIVRGDSNDVLVDRGPFAANGVFSGSPAYTGAPLAVNPAPIQAVVANKDNTGLRKGYLFAENTVVPVTF